MASASFLDLDQALDGGLFERPFDGPLGFGKVYLVE